MLFGRSGQQQAQAPQNAQAAPSAQGAQLGYGAQQSSPWTGVGGYPSQPAGTGYAGYTPGTAQTAGGYSAGAMPQGQTGYAGGTGYNPYPQMGQSAAGYPQGAQGYAPQGQTYAQPGQSYAQQSAQTWNPQQGYAQPAQGYAQQGQSYAQPQGGGYSYPQMNPGAGYAGQAGYTQSQPQGYTQGGYNAYAQMGRNQQPQQPDYGGQIPLNGGGYVPPAVPVKKQPFVFQSWMLIALSAVLVILFALGLILKMNVLLWIFAALAVGSVAFFWIRPLVSGNRRLCYTVVFAVLSVIAVVTALGVLNGVGARDETRTPGASVAAGAQTQSATASSGGTVIDPQTGSVISAVAEEQATATPTPVVEDTATTDRLESFFRYWAANKQDDMLALCSPSWQSSVDNPKTSLFGLIANRTPLDYALEKVSGTVDDTSRTVTVTTTMDRNNGKDPVKYRLSVLMQNEGGQWYVDPQSLKTYEEAETPDPSITDTPAPTEEPQVSGSTILYYNPDGGTKYHLDQNCKSTHAKYLPMKGHFTYAEINDDAYVKLTPCNVCAAPLRP